LRHYYHYYYQHAQGDNSPSSWSERQLLPSTAIKRTVKVTSHQIRSGHISVTRTLRFKSQHVGSDQRRSLSLYTPEPTMIHSVLLLFADDSISNRNVVRGENNHKDDDGSFARWHLCANFIRAARSTIAVVVLLPFIITMGIFMLPLVVFGRCACRCMASCDASTHNRWAMREDSGSDTMEDDTDSPTIQSRRSPVHHRRRLRSR